MVNTSQRHRVHTIRLHLITRKRLYPISRRRRCPITSHQSCPPRLLPTKLLLQYRHLRLVTHPRQQHSLHHNRIKRVMDLRPPQCTISPRQHSHTTNQRCSTLRPRCIDPNPAHAALGYHGSDGAHALSNDIVLNVDELTPTGPHTAWTLLCNPGPRAIRESSRLHRLGYFKGGQCLMFWVP